MQAIYWPRLILNFGKYIKSIYYFSRFGHLLFVSICDYIALMYAKFLYAGLHRKYTHLSFLIFLISIIVLDLFLFLMNTSVYSCMFSVPSPFHPANQFYSQFKQIFNFYVNFIWPQEFHYHFFLQRLKVFILKKYNKINHHHYRLLAI